MNNLSYIPQFVSVSDLQRNYPSILKSLKKSQNPLLILKKNDLEAVIVTPGFYKSIMDKIQYYEERDAMTKIWQYKTEKKGKKLKKMENVSELFA